MVQKWAQKWAEIFMAENGAYLPPERFEFICQRLMVADESRLTRIAEIKFKNPVAMQAVSVLLGIFGVDCFLLGERKRGILKLLTLGGLGVLAVTDWFSIRKRTRERNYNDLFRLLCGHDVPAEP